MKEEELSRNDVVEVLKWANDLYGSYMGVYSPYMSHQLLVELNNNPSIPTRDKLDKALKGVPYDTETLRAFSEFAETYDPIYQRSIDYKANLLAFDLGIYCRNAYRGEADYKSQEFKDDVKRVYKFLNNFDYLTAFRDVVKNCQRAGTNFVWFRDSEGTFDETGEIVLDDNGDAKTKRKSTYALQMMPQRYCLLTDRWEFGYLYSFYMSYFTQAGVDIREYDPVFLKYWKNTLGSQVGEVPYVPTNKLDNRFGTFGYITQTSPDDGAFVFLADTSNPNAAPPFSAMIRNAITDVEMEALQRSANILAARAILAGEIPRLDKQKSGETQDAMAWKPETLIKYMKLVKAGLIDGLNAVAMPTENMDFYQYENKNPDMYEKQLSTSAGNSVSASRMIYSSDKAGQFEIQAQIQTDYNSVKKMYQQFNNFMNFYVNKKTKKYKFNFVFSGSTYDFMRKEEKDNLLKLADRGLVLNASSYAKIVDMQPQDFDAALEEAHWGGLTDKLTMLLSIHTQSGKDGQSGRPQMSETEISDSGQDNKDI